MPRVKASAADPFGEPADSNPMCRPLRDQLPRTFAVVGNGPLTEQNRADIARCDKVLR